MRKADSTKPVRSSDGNQAKLPSSRLEYAAADDSAVVRVASDGNDGHVWNPEILEAIPDAVLLVGSDGRILQANSHACALFGYPVEGLKGREIEDLIPEPFGTDLRQHRVDYFLNPTVFPMGTTGELLARRKDGSEFPIEISLSPMHAADGDVAVAAVRDITLRNRAEEQLRASEERYRTLVDQVSDGIFTADQSGKYTDVNSSGCRLTGYTRADIMERTIADLIVPEEVPRVGPAIEEMQQGRAQLAEWTFRRKDGRTFRGEVSASILSDGRMVGILRDASERRRSEELIRESEERFRVAIDSMQEGFIMQNRSGEVVICNRSAERILGLTAEQMMGKSSFAPAWKPIHEDGTDFRQDERPLVQSLARGIAYSGVVMGVPQQGGDVKWVLVNTTPLLRGDEPYAAIATFIDITERRRAENAIRESEERFRTLADSPPVLIWMTDADGNCTYLNRPWLEFTGHTLEDGLGSGWARSLHPDDHDRLVDEFSRCIESREPIRSEYRMRRHDGQYRHFVAVGIPRLSDDGELLEYIGSSIDNTEQQAALEQNFESQKLESLGRLAGGVAHDFNNLLTAITGYAELARMEAPVDSEVFRFLGNVMDAAERAASLTSQLLMFSRRQMVTFGPVDLNTVILGMDSLLRRTIGEGLQFDLLLDERLWTVNSSAAQMEQVLMNLVVNARDALPAGGRILVRTANVAVHEKDAALLPGGRAGEYVTFAVTDNGPGISREIQERIFEPFFTTKVVGKGTGLGLATCYGIVKQSGGIIDVQSESGRGATFRVYLPRLHRELVAEEPASPAADHNGTETVLLVDDEPMVRDLACRFLRSQGLHVLEAGNGAEALHVAGQWAGVIDLLVTDVVMPLMGGAELAQRLRRTRPGVKVLYITGYTHDTIVAQGVVDPDVTLLTKPFSSAELSATVRQAIAADSSR
jgi:two-component system cell cycle sensor histidine kinase/response regulator CckA